MCDSEMFDSGLGTVSTVTGIASINQLRGIVFGAAILVNSYNPVSGQIRYFVGLPDFGCGKLAIRASFDAFEGRININWDPLSFEASVYFDVVGVGSEVLEALADAGLDDRVRVMMMYRYQNLGARNIYCSNC